MKWCTLLTVCGLAALTLGGGLTPHAGAQPGQPDKAALKRAQKQVKMLDDIYKLTIVAITSKYVKSEADYPAGRVAIHLFKDITEKGWHDVRLIDVSGKPYNAKNVANDKFEKDAVKVMKSGKQYYEEVEITGGKHYLRAMTFVPVVLEKCTLCHPNYKTAQKNEAVGAISYKIEIE